MRIVPVIDLMRGEVVHAVGGRRSDYRPLCSALCNNSRPLDVACALRHWFGLEEFYLADLDAIAGAAPARSTCDELTRNGFRLWVDAGFRRLCHTWEQPDRLVVGLETLEGPDALTPILAQGSNNVMLSLDLRNGAPLGDRTGWKVPTPAGIAAEAVALGVRRLLVLDLARVGEAGGTGTEDLCAALAANHPGVEILAGGGVRDRADLLRLKACGVSAALVASALHDGRLTPADLEGL